MVALGKSVALILSAGTLMYVASEPVKPKGDANLAKLVTDYRSWKRVNGSPKLMPPKISELCRDTTGMKDPPERSTVSPHDVRWFNVYVNRIAEPAMWSTGRTQFPVGSIIVKEKLASYRKKEVELMTVMVKRPSGFDSKVGDWEFFVVQKGRATQNDVSGCKSCHARYAKHDFVFKDYDTPEIRH